MEDKKTDIVHCHDYHPLLAMLLANLFFAQNFMSFTTLTSMKVKKWVWQKQVGLQYSFLRKSHLILSMDLLQSVDQF